MMASQLQSKRMVRIHMQANDMVRKRNPQSNTRSSAGHSALSGGGGEGRLDSVSLDSSTTESGQVTVLSPIGSNSELRMSSSSSSVSSGSGAALVSTGRRVSASTEGTEPGGEGGEIKANEFVTSRGEQMTKFSGGAQSGGSAPLSPFSLGGTNGPGAHGVTSSFYEAKEQVELLRVELERVQSGITLLSQSIEALADIVRVDSTCCGGIFELMGFTIGGGGEGGGGERGRPRAFIATGRSGYDRVDVSFADSSMHSTTSSTATATPMKPMLKLTKGTAVTVLAARGPGIKGRGGSVGSSSNRAASVRGFIMVGSDDLEE